MPDDIIKEYLERAATTAGEVLEHFAIVGIPKVPPDQEEEGVLVQPVMKLSGNAALLCMLSDQMSVELHRLRLEMEDMGGPNGPSLS